MQLYFHQNFFTRYHLLRYDLASWQRYRIRFYTLHFLLNVKYACVNLSSTGFASIDQSIDLITCLHRANTLIYFNQIDMR